VKIALTIAGSDSGGGAGIQADLKTFQQFGVFGTSAIVALTAQNTVGVRAVEPVSSAMIAAQLAALAEDLPPAAVKSGMLGTAATVRQVAQLLQRYQWHDYVLDPVMVASSGDRLLTAEAESVLREALLPLARLVHDVKPFIAKKGWTIPGDDVWLEKMIATLRERAKNGVQAVREPELRLDVPRIPTHNDQRRCSPTASSLSGTSYENRGSRSAWRRETCAATHPRRRCFGQMP